MKARDSFLICSSILCIFVLALTLAAGAFAALLCIRTADAFLSAALRADDIDCRAADDESDQGDHDDISDHFAASVLSLFFCFTMSAVKTAAISKTTDQPSTGIQGSPSEPPVMSVPKKNVKNPTV